MHFHLVMEFSYKTWNLLRIFYIKWNRKWKISLKKMNKMKFYANNFAKFNANKKFDLISHKMSCDKKSLTILLDYFQCVSKFVEIYFDHNISNLYSFWFNIHISILWFIIRYSLNQNIANLWISFFNKNSLHLLNQLFKSFIMKFILITSYKYRYHISFIKAILIYYVSVIINLLWRK